LNAPSLTQPCHPANRLRHPEQSGLCVSSFEVSSRAKRSAVEGSAVAFSSLNRCKICNFCGVGLHNKLCCYCGLYFCNVLVVNYLLIKCKLFLALWLLLERAVVFASLLLPGREGFMAQNHPNSIVRVKGIIICKLVRKNSHVGFVQVCLLETLFGGLSAFRSG
jgi:hypothetical protein